MATIVVLDRIEPGQEPPYAVHGRATCVGPCGEWVWLSALTVDIVSEGNAEPLCLPCAEHAFQAMQDAGDNPPVRLANLHGQRNE